MMMIIIATRGNRNEYGKLFLMMMAYDNINEHFITILSNQSDNQNRNDS